MRGPELNPEEEKQLDHLVDALIEDYMDENYGLPIDQDKVA